MFISFEGCEGSGKSTQSKLLNEYLLSSGIDSILTREVGGTKQSEEIRQILMKYEFHEISELMLIMAARYEHVKKVISPSLQKGKWVICDRFIDSTLCYQSNKTKIDDIYDLHKKFINIVPDITFFMDMNPEISVNRANKRKNTNRYDNMDIEIHIKIYNKFKQLSKNTNRIIPIDASKTENEIHMEIVNSLITSNLLR